jgi:hypothetical protein
MPFLIQVKESLLLLLHLSGMSAQLSLSLLMDLGQRLNVLNRIQLLKLTTHQKMKEINKLIRKLMCLLEEAQG